MLCSVAGTTTLDREWLSLIGVTFYPNTPKYTQIQLQIILFLLFWDVLWIINDLLAPLLLFFHKFQQNSQFLWTISNDPDLGRIAYNHEYTLQFIANAKICMYFVSAHQYIFCSLLKYYGLGEK